MTDTPYTLPEVWVWEKGDSPKWRYSNTNRPIAGATHEKELPRGKHPLQLYSQATPNGVKVTIMLEELLAAGHSGAEYDAWLIRIGEGDQFGSGFVGVNPNSKIPAFVDYSEQTPRRVFESGAILLYLADKFGAFLPKDRGKRTEALNWLFWQLRPVTDVRAGTVTQEDAGAFGRSPESHLAPNSGAASCPRTCQIHPPTKRSILPTRC
jgi:GSH-dependent disulfide-bond oxidoreductase